MGDIKWIKLSTALFDNRKIKQIRKMPDGDALIVVWLQILCLAGQLNDSGMVYFSKDIPYTEEMLATEFDRPINTIRLALTVFQQFGMIEIVDSILLVSNWEKYQSADKLAKLNEQNRERQARFKSKQKSNVMLTLPVTQGNATELEQELELELDISSKEDIRVDYQQIADLYNATCVSFPKITTLSEARKKAIKARSRKYSIDILRSAFEKAEASEFLKGSNKRNWSADFDWLIKDANIAKVLDGNYDNKKSKHKNDSDPYGSTNIDSMLEEQFLKESQHG